MLTAVMCVMSYEGDPSKMFSEFILIFIRHGLQSVSTKYLMEKFTSINRKAPGFTIYKLDNLLLTFSAKSINNRRVGFFFPDLLS